MVNVFIIDDHPAIIQGVEFMLSDDPDGIHFAGSAENVPDALDQLSDLDVEVILLDLFIGSTQPVNNLHQIRSICPESAVVIYSAEDSTHWKYKMFKAGANAYLSKCSHNDTLMATIHKISDGSVLLTGDMNNMFNKRAKNEKSDSLTPEELEVCFALAFGKSLQQIADQQGKSISSIEKTLRMLRNNHGAESNAELIRILINRKIIPFSN